MSLLANTTAKENLYNKLPHKEEKDSAQSISQGFVLIDDDSEEKIKDTSIRHKIGGSSSNLDPIDSTDGDSPLTSIFQTDDTIIFHAKNFTAISTEQNLAEINYNTAFNKPYSQTMSIEVEKMMKASKEVSTEKEDFAILESCDHEVEELSPPRYPAIENESSLNAGSSRNSNEKQQPKKKTTHKKNKSKVPSKPSVPTTRSSAQASEVNTDSTSDHKPRKQQDFSLKVDLFTEDVGYDFLSGGSKISTSIGFFSSLLKNNQMNPASVQSKPTMPYPVVSVAFQDTGKASCIFINRLSVELDQVTNAVGLNQDIGHSGVITVNASAFNNEVGNDSNKRFGKKTGNYANKEVSPTRSAFESTNRFVSNWVLPPILIVICFIIADNLINMINSQSF